ncbi:MAG: WG repeat-containing protein [Alistipes sp.]|nr:WG repeat-containing protein [Alistipes sp.]
MTIPISQYMEALWSPDGRFRTLERLHAVRDEAGMPVFEVPGRGAVDLEVVTAGRRWTLRCPLNRSADAAARLHAFAGRDRGLDGRFFTEWRVLPSEVVLFDADGETFEVDILARPTPEGEPLADLLARAVAGGDAAAVRRVAASFEELLEWARRVGRADAISMHRLIAASDGTLRLTGFSASGEAGRIRELLHKAAGAPQNTGYDFDGTYTGTEGEVRCVKDGGGWVYVDRAGRAITASVWTAAEPFRAGRATVETTGGKGLIDTDGREVLAPLYEEVVWDDRWGVATVMIEGRWSLTDRDGRALTAEPYDWIGECSEGLILAVKGGRCGFLDTSGCEAIPFIYDNASSFSEGCSVVTLGPETFLVDSRGRRI